MSSIHHILVVDDGEAGRSVLETILGFHGFRVSTASNGESALALARQSPPDLVISDVLMPVMDGFTLCRNWRADPQLRSVPFVLYSSTYDDPKDRDLASAVGADRFASAPLEPSQLLELVREVEAASSQGTLGPREPIPVDATFLQAYNEALIRQLEHKISEVEQVNAELENRVRERTRELEIANKELEAFAYSVAHDLRAPLRAISGYSSLLSQEAASLPPGSAHHHLEAIEQNVGRMAQLIDDLLMLSRLGRQPLKKQRVALRPLIEAALEDVSPAREGRNVELIVAPNLPDASADPSLLRQAFVNLLDNALKFTRPQTLARIEVGSQRLDDGTTAYFVRDNGVGFDMADAKKLFLVFQRLHRDEFEGAGAGLAVLSRIIDRHGGRVWAQGKPGEGATFYFTLGGRGNPASSG
ncbi:MAG TPA: ATP-binding protein [Thermoanaerobaculia bacterium]|nr:ATP-binding protein [Thermoanaerobaculia bacterium]